MEDNLTFLEKSKTTLIFWNMENNLNFFEKWKMISIFWANWKKTSICWLALASPELGTAQPQLVYYLWHIQVI